MTSHELVLYGKGKGKAIDDPLQRKFARRTIDYGSNVVRWLEDCLQGPTPSHRLQSHYSYTRELMPPFATPQSPYDSICCRFVHSATNKNRAPVNVVHWFPNGRRLMTGTQTGEMTVWNGFQFHFENIMQAHNAAIRAMQWTPEETVCVSGDQLGMIKFWDQYLYNFQTFQAHKESICDITVAPTGTKFCSCADDSHAKVWDLRTGEEERAFTGHGWDVKCCHWHPTKGLVATGSKDSQIKLWDPRASEAITTIFCHKNTVTRVAWSPDGQYLASGSRDQLIMLMDIRTMSVRKVFKAHQKEVTALCWHPETSALLASGGYDADIHFWDTLGGTEPIESVKGAHEGPIWSLSWHPLGHLLVSGSHDYSTRFWSRARPGDTSWEDILPKKIGLGASEAAALVVPQAPLPKSVYDAGIFAEPSPPYKAPVIPEGGLPLVPVLSKADAEKAKAPARTVSGLSLGEGASRKELFDTSDFDELEEKVTPLAELLAEIQPPKDKTVVSPAVPAAEKAAPAVITPKAVEPKVIAPPAQEEKLAPVAAVASATPPKEAAAAVSSQNPAKAEEKAAALAVQTTPSAKAVAIEPPKAPAAPVAPVPSKPPAAAATSSSAPKAAAKSSWVMAPKLNQKPDAAKDASPEPSAPIPTPLAAEVATPTVADADPLRAMALAQLAAAEGEESEAEKDSGEKRQAEAPDAATEASPEAKRLKTDGEVSTLSET